MSNRPVPLLAPVTLGLVLALAVLAWLFAGQATRFDEAALGFRTQGVFLPHGDRMVHCRQFPEAEHCAETLRQWPVRSRTLVMSASQLYSINDYSAGQVTAPWRMTDHLLSKGHGLVALSLPNMNFQEQLIAWLRIAELAPLDGLVLPLVYDDMREDGVRPGIALATREPGVTATLTTWAVGQTLLARLNAPAAPIATSMAGTVRKDPSTQERTEDWLTGALEDCCGLMSLRAEARGQIALATRQTIHRISQWRNLHTRDSSALRIPVPPANYQTNRAALEAILADAARRGTRVLLYVVPRPTDFFPYDPAGYAAFKADMADLARTHGARLVNLEDLVPNEEWGVTDITVGYPIRDHFHFRASGHQRLADALTPLVEELVR